MKIPNIVISIPHEIMQDRGYDEAWLQKFLIISIMKTGYNKLDGIIEKYDAIESKNKVFTYYPSKRDILFKQFKRWKPEWMKKKEILFRSWR
ncbi:MAG: hypothetical protein KKD48_05255 [Nanoarchaeota archaeon]|nr:hypothetical protein [Nanoarchaeota archaeon]